MIEPIYRFHPSSLHAIMGDAQAMDVTQLTADELAIWRKKSRTDAEQAAIDAARARSLSEGAKSFCKGIVKELLYGEVKRVDTKEMRKGRECEQAVIQLYNNVTFQRLAKNTERRRDELLTGECDLLVPGERTIDAKASWSIDTFPLLSEDAHSAIYEWQGRGYMRLWDVPEHEVFYGLVDTPDDLIGHESVGLHKVDHIEPKLRITRVVYKRDMELERRIEIKVRAAQRYIAETIAKTRSEHGVVASWRAQFAN